MKIQVTTIFAIAALLALASPTLAQTNDFFGSAPGQGSNTSPPPGAEAASQQLNKADFTADEKRMQKKYKHNVAEAQRRIAKADRMIKDGEKRKDDKAVKKGKILKEISEKHLAELKANNPLPDAQR